MNNIENIEKYPSGRNQTDLPDRSDGVEERNRSGMGSRTEKGLPWAKCDGKISAAKREIQWNSIDIVLKVRTRGIL
jgi:hypothetical protein